MICIYAQDCTDFSNNGLGVLTPMSCTVTETLNGEYELTLEHPTDDYARVSLINVGNIIRAPVPRSHDAATESGDRRQRRYTECPLCATRCGCARAPVHRIGYWASTPRVPRS